MRHRCDEGDELDLSVSHLRLEVQHLHEEIEELEQTVLYLLSQIEPVGPAVSVQIIAKPLGAS